MKIRITKGGIFGKDGEIPVGTELTVKDEPKGWAGRYDVLSRATEGKTAVTNPAKTGDVKSAADVLAMADGNFMAFKSAASKLLGEAIPSTKDEIITALKAL